ncbi:MAG: hypothetical protein KAX38_06395 [Candidatus Krumholzibacteria bacterium]|nr:hypothetical protein [Candidatus Krumholzibacteria bacterium]
MSEEKPEYKTKNVFEIVDDKVKDVIGEVVEINGKRYEIVGITVAPEHKKIDDGVRKGGK